MFCPRVLPQVMGKAATISKVKNGAQPIHMNYYVQYVGTHLATFSEDNIMLSLSSMLKLSLVKGARSQCLG
jgi:hypothetical protein